MHASQHLQPAAASISALHKFISSAPPPDRPTRGGPLSLVTAVTTDHPGEWDRPTPEWARGELLRIECRVICPRTGKFLHDTHYSRLEYAPSGNLREQNDPPHQDTGRTSAKSSSSSGRR